MASATVNRSFLCRFCPEQFPDRASMASHLPHCAGKNPTNKAAEPLRAPRLNKFERNLLQMLNLHRCSDKRVPFDQSAQPNPDLQIPLSAGRISLSTQSSFDDSLCHYVVRKDTQVEQDPSPLGGSAKAPATCHLYKYSRREQRNFYASIKRARLKKQFSTTKRPTTSALSFNHKHGRIHLPTRIASRQRLNTNGSNSYPLMFDANFHSLVQLTSHSRLASYLPTIRVHFHLIHSIASQEFQIIVNSNDQQHHVSYTMFSLINILRQTMTDYSINLQKSLKRNYFQTFQPHDPPSLPATTSAIDRVRHPPATVDLTSVDRPPQPIDRTNTEPLIDSFRPVVEPARAHRSPSPVLLKKQKLEPVQIEEPIPVLTRPRIRVVNECIEVTKPSPSRKKPSQSLGKLDENAPSTPARMSTRTSSIKAEPIAEAPPPFQSIPVILSSSVIGKQWLTHNVFYRCHACAHEEFFVVLSRECMNLHISSKHGNMEENFRRRVRHFLNKKGRALQIVQHHLKWQQPWSEKEVEQIFALANK